MKKKCECVVGAIPKSLTLVVVVEEGGKGEKTHLPSLEEELQLSFVQDGTDASFNLLARGFLW